MGGGGAAPAPQVVDYNESMREALQAQIDLAPELYRAEMGQKKAKATQADVDAGYASKVGEEVWKDAGGGSRMDYARMEQQIIGETLLGEGGGEKFADTGALGILAGNQTLTDENGNQRKVGYDAQGNFMGTAAVEEDLRQIQQNRQVANEIKLAENNAQKLTDAIRTDDMDAAIANAKTLASKSSNPADIKAPTSGTALEFISARAGVKGLQGIDRGSAIKAEDGYDTVRAGMSPKNIDQNIQYDEIGGPANVTQVNAQNNNLRASQGSGFREVSGNLGNTQIALDGGFERVAGAQNVGDISLSQQLSQVGSGREASNVAGGAAARDVSVGNAAAANIELNARDATVGREAGGVALGREVGNVGVGQRARDVTAGTVGDLGGLRSGLTSAAMSDLSLGGDLSAEERRSIEEDARAAAMARGRLRDTTSIVDEVASMESARRERRNERRAFASQVAAQEAGLAQSDIGTNLQAQQLNQAADAEFAGRQQAASMADQQAQLAMGQREQAASMADQQAQLAMGAREQSASQANQQADLAMSQNRLSLAQMNQQTELANLSNQLAASQTNQSADEAYQARQLQAAGMNQQTALAMGARDQAAQQANQSAELNLRGMTLDASRINQQKDMDLQRLNIESQAMNQQADLASRDRTQQARMANQAQDTAMRDRSLQASMANQQADLAGQQRNLDAELANINVVSQNADRSQQAMMANQQADLARNEQTQSAQLANQRAQMEKSNMELQAELANQQTKLSFSELQVQAQQANQAARAADKQIGLSAQMAEQERISRRNADNLAVNATQQQTDLALMNAQIAARNQDIDRGLQIDTLNQQMDMQALQADRAAAQNMVSIEQSTSADPFMAITGRPSGQTTTVGQSAYGMGAMGVGAAPTLYNPAQGAEFMANQAAGVNSYNAANYAAKQSARAGMFAGAVGAIGQIGGAAIKACWVAREVYGMNNPKWKLFRIWLFNFAPAWFRFIYLKFGERLAKFISDKPRLKKWIRSWMDRRIMTLNQNQVLEVA